MAFSKYLNFTIPLLKNFINGCKSACFVSCLSSCFFCWPDFCVMLCQVFSLYYTSIYYLLSLCFPSASMFGFLRLIFFQGLIWTSFFNKRKLKKKSSSFFFLLKKLCSNFLFWLNEANEIVLWILLFQHEKTRCILENKEKNR